MEPLGGWGVGTGMYPKNNKFVTESRAVRFEVLKSGDCEESFFFGCNSV